MFKSASARRPDGRPDLPAPGRADAVREVHRAEEDDGAVAASPPQPVRVGPRRAGGLLPRAALLLLHALPALALITPPARGRGRARHEDGLGREQERGLAARAVRAVLDLRVGETADAAAHDALGARARD